MFEKSILAIKKNKVIKKFTINYNGPLKPEDYFVGPDMFAWDRYNRWEEGDDFDLDQYKADIEKYTNDMKVMR